MRHEELHRRPTIPGSNFMTFFKTLLLPVALMTVVGIAQAGTALTQGSHLTPAEVAAMSTTASRYTVGGTSLTVVPAANGVTTKSTDGSTVTTVVNAGGVVGTSRNEVLVAQVATDTVRAQGATLLAGAHSVSYYDHMQITSVRYASFAQATAAFEQWRTAFPKAQVTLPVEYHQRKPR
ncbi:hypothetical protein GN316_12760 [Xylophilus sp. Kf1]|nr:hypothetical protein [Xylophilus sp. Kf1]